MGSFATTNYEIQDQHDRAQKAAALQMQTAPLAQSINADRVRLASYVDPKTLQPLPGHEDDYSTTLNRMADNIGQMRTLMGDKAPNDDPGRLKLAAAKLLDRTHITNDLEGHVRGSQTDKANAYHAQNENAAQQAGSSVLPFEMTPEGQKAAYGRQTAIDVANARESPSLKLFKMKDGTFQYLDAKKPIPEGAQPITVSATNTKPIKGPMVKSKQSPTGFAQTYLDPMDPNHVVAYQPVTPSRYYTGTQTSSVTTDPFGVTSTSQHTTQPMLGGEVDLSKATAMPAEPEGMAPPQATPPPQPSSASPTVGPKTQKLRKLAANPPQQSGGSKQLDETGHIPAGVEPNSMLREAANQLLDGMDINKLNVPARDKQAAAHLAGKYGWGQGKFTPRELTQVQESKQLIDSIRKSPETMAIYGANPAKRAIIAQRIYGAPPKTDVEALKETAANNMFLNPADIRFIQDFRQLVGRIQGLAQLTRGSGRPTEAAVKRMISELPDPRIVTSPEQAQHAFDLINNEIEIATKTGAPQGATGSKTKVLKETKSLSERLSEALEGK